MKTLPHALRTAWLDQLRAHNSLLNVQKNMDDIRPYEFKAYTDLIGYNDNLIRELEALNASH